MNTKYSIKKVWYYLLCMIMTLQLIACTEETHESYTAAPEVEDIYIDQLEELINKMKDLQKNSEYGEKKGQYPTESRAILTDAIDDANRSVLLIKYQNPVPSEQEKQRYVASAKSAIDKFKGTIRTEDAETTPAELFVDDKGANLYQKADGSLTTNPTSDDLVVKGQASPKWTVGWNNTVTWKNWTLNVFFNAATGYDRLNISRFMAASMTGVSRFVTLRDAYFKGWDHVANKADALYPSLTNTDNKSYANSDFWLEDASFIKLKNISLSYRIPRRVLKFASVQLSVSAQDLFTITRYKGMDPEVYTSYDGLDYGAYPIPRTITFGAKIRF